VVEEGSVAHVHVRVQAAPVLVQVVDAK
jgi:hypothetical protein